MAGKIKKVLILADNDPFLSLRIATNLYVQSFVQADFKNMLTIKASFAEILS